MLTSGILSLTATALGLMITPWVRALALRLGAVDEPGEPRSHLGHIPCLGGVAVLGAFLGALGFCSLIDHRLFTGWLHSATEWPWLLAGALVVTATGVIDDLWGLAPARKLALQSVAGVMVLASGFRITTVTDPLAGGHIALGWLASLGTLLWVIGLTNALNLLDGLDGLAAGVATLAAVTVWAISIVTGRIDVALPAGVLAGALLGFLPYNAYPASIFLGDSGSLLLGYLLSLLSIQAAQCGTTGVVILVPISILGLPILDTLLAIVRRLWRAARLVYNNPHRRSYHFVVVGAALVVRRDREHIHHRLLAMGLTHRGAVLVLYGVSGGLDLMTLLALGVLCQ